MKRTVVHAIRSVAVAVAVAVGLACGLAGAGPAPLEAQSLVRGQLEHASSRQPVAGAVVELLGTARERFGATLSDSLGLFSLVAPGPGAYQVRVVHPDYETVLSEPLQVDRDGEGVDLVLFLGIQGYELAPIQVMGRSDARLLSGRESFERHRALGQGRFITAEEIMAKNLRAASQMLIGEEGVIPLAMPDGTMAYHPLRGGRRCLRTVVNGQWNSLTPPIRTFEALGRARMGVGEGFIEAVERIAEEQTTPDRAGTRLLTRGIDDLIDPSAIAGVEFYREVGEMPEEWRREVGGCGLVMIWTRAAW